MFVVMFLFTVSTTVAGETSECDNMSTTLKMFFKKVLLYLSLNISWLPYYLNFCVGSKAL